ncbi:MULTISPECIES: hypothetical protein [Cyclobacteriaceae]|jgi:hypothetical protein|uniref:Uncharacterized protein n=2 Tax=Cyclobacteriaceae TaxID=563798 RepID=A0A841MMD8_9BACT|nr:MULTISPECIES: hypothetical protein [Cyclobacteriaceae]MBB6325396.1 hypothetical protein [Algoriphagus iocasae]MBR9776467.1 hypothetical protein [Cytophagales bacterium]GGF43868.1 hypothetical protein GCM10011339_35480 [Echinicola rosea]|tara:strand:+ start:10753 stop:10953 length:201 start_codon:yes stop_codon:yes gene_type:complete
MPENYNQQYEDLEDKLRMIDLEEDNLLKKSELSFQRVLIAINRLQNVLTKNLVDSQAGEILFFKEI